jgi:hypothetical protein
MSLSIIYKKLAEDFCNIYYNKIANEGLNSVTYLFCQDAKCSYNNNFCTGGYELLLNFSKIGIQKFGHFNLNVSGQSLFNNEILVNVTGSVYPTYFSGLNGDLLRFSELFILRNFNGSYFITNYMLNTITN